MQTQSNERIAVVRAIPQPGHKHRWCGLERWIEDKKARPHPEQKHGLPWPASELKVRVVDEPAPYDPNANGGAPVEISPSTFDMLKRDERIAVRMLEGEGGDPDEVVMLKAQVVELDKKLTEAQRALAGEQERFRTLHLTSQRQVEEQGAKLAAIEHELAAARAQLGSRKPR
jgi:hypothetical protein